MSDDNAGRELRKAVQDGRKLTDRQREFLVDVLYDLDATAKVLADNPDASHSFRLGAAEVPVSKYREFVAAEESGSDGAA